MLKDTKTKETVEVFVTFLSLVSFQLGGGPGPCPPPWLRLWHTVTEKIVIHFATTLMAKHSTNLEDK